MKINKEKLDQLLSAVRSGTDLETACHFAGLSINEVFKDLETGKLNENIENKSNTYEVTLWVELKKARAQAVVRNVSHIQKAANDGDWKAAAWWLEKTLPETYNKKTNSKQIEK